MLEGGGGRESPDQISVDTIERDFHLNVFAAWRLCQLVAPHMNKAGYGSIINISSMSSINKKSCYERICILKSSFKPYGR